MTDPQTTSLKANEWQALCYGGATQLAGLFGSTGTLDDAAYQAASDHMARLGMFMRAWRASSAVERPPVAPQVDYVAEHAGLQPGHLHPAANGSDPDISPITGKPKRKYTRKAKPEAGGVLYSGVLEHDWDD